MKKIISFALMLIILSSSVTVYADYTIKSGSYEGCTVRWNGDNNITVTDANGNTVYQGAGIQSDNGHLVPPVGTDSNGNIKMTISTAGGGTENFSVAPSYSHDGTNYYYSGTDTSLLMTDSNGNYIGTTSATREQDRVLPADWVVNHPDIANQVVNATGGYFNAHPDNTDSKFNTGDKTNMPSMLGDANIIGNQRTFVLTDSSGKPVLSVPATEYQNGWASYGAYVISYKDLKPNDLQMLKDKGFAYDDAHGVLILQNTKREAQYANSTVWQQAIGAVNTGNSDMDIALNTLRKWSQMGYHLIPCRQTTAHLPKNMKWAPDLFNDPQVGTLSGDSPVLRKFNRELKDYIAKYNYSSFDLTDPGCLVDFCANCFAEGKSYLINTLVNYATHSGIATIQLPGDNTNPSNPSNPQDNTNPPVPPDNNTNPPDNNSPLEPSNYNPPNNNSNPPPQPITADDVHATITVNKTPNFVYTKWHTDENGYPAYMDITIKWKDVEIGSIIDMPDGPHEIRQRAWISDVKALHNIHRYTNYGNDYDYETETPVDQSIDYFGQQATFRFQYRKPGKEDSKFFFKLYLDGTDRYFTVYADIPVNGFNATYFNDNKDHTDYGFLTSNPYYKQTPIQTQTISF
ncbi:MAG: hypothetical protein QME35_03020 [Thermoanaerobacteraceae bacterium]|nr:hypothetical protein [Thermoanaerobacteraceae bacterium]